MYRYQNTSLTNQKLTILFICLGRYWAPSSVRKLLEKRLRRFDRNLLAHSGFLERRVMEAEPYCWFCSTETNPLSKEHVFPRWLQRELGLERQTIEPIRILSDLVTIGSRRPSHTLSSLTVGGICQDCNNGWMSRLEASAPEVLIENQREAITTEQALLFARWMTKTAICINVSMPYRLLFDKDARHSLNSGMPALTHVFIYRARKNTHEINWRQSTLCAWFFDEEDSEIVKDSAALTYVGHITLGKIAAVVVKIPASLSAYQLEVTSDAAKIWPSERLPTWGSIPRFNRFTDPVVSIRLKRYFQDLS